MILLATVLAFALYPATESVETDLQQSQRYERTQPNKFVLKMHKNFINDCDVFDHRDDLHLN
jgi:hypothetical protein